MTAEELKSEIIRVVSLWSHAMEHATLAVVNQHAKHLIELNRKLEQLEGKP